MYASYKKTFNLELIVQESYSPWPSCQGAQYHAVRQTVRHYAGTVTKRSYFIQIHETEGERERGR